MVRHCHIFVLLNNYVTLGLQKHMFLITSDIRQFFLRSGDVWKVRHNYVASCFVLELCYKCFYFSWRYFSFVVCCITYGNNPWNNIWKLRFVFVCHCDLFSILSQLLYLFVWCSYVSWWRWHYVIFWYIRITYGNNVKLRFVFISHCDAFLSLSQLRYLFVHVVTFFDDVRNSFYFCTFELRMEITLQLCFGFVRHFNVFLLRHNYVISWFHIVTFFDDVRITLYFATFELRMEITLQLRFVFVRDFNVFFITLQLRYLFVRCSYIFWWR